MITNFFVFTSPHEQEEDQPKTCFIAIDTQDKMTEFADHLEKDTLLSVLSIVKHREFFYTFGSLLYCTVLEVHIKEEAAALQASCEQIAIAETYSYLTRLSIKPDKN